MDKKVRNRRYKKLQELIEDSDYFSEENIKMRDPLLYHMYIGRFQRNQDANPGSLMITDIAFQRLDKLEYETALKDHFKKNKDYFIC